MTALDGADGDTVSRALEANDPFPGTAGFAGALEGVLLRDVLGRRPLFYDHDDWAFAPGALSRPTRLPAGCRRQRASESPEPPIERVWSLPNPEPTADTEAAVDSVRRAVERSVRELDPDGLAVAFSGGVDSATVAAGVPEAPCYVVGFEGARDVERARESAQVMDRELRVVELSHGDIERAVPTVAAAVGRTNAMDVAIALTLYLVAEAVATDGYDRLAVGQGADELFGGYAKVADPDGDGRIEANTVRGARRETLLGLPDQLERDVLALRAAGVEPATPLLHDRVIRAALPLPAELLATGDERKVAFRRATDRLLPGSIRRAEKTAAQYGSYVSRELDRLARRAGFKRRMDDHVKKYVQDLVASADVEVPTIADPRRVDPDD